MTQLLLITKLNLIHKRFYPGEIGHTQKLLNIVNKISPKKKIQNSKATLDERLLTNKIVFLNFCNHFKEIPLADLINDAIFIKWVHKSHHETPTLQSRAFQLALEVTYPKRHFSQPMLEKFYENDFNIEDTLDINKGICDQSTIYSAVLTKYITNYFNLDKKDITVISSPLFLKKTEITSEIQEIMVFNKKITDNSMPDLKINQRVYDFKESKNISWNKNHIYLFDIKNIEKKGASLLKELEQSLRNQIKSQSSAFSEESQKYAKDILNILKNKPISTQAMFDKIQEHVLKNLPPKDFRIPFIIPIKKANGEELKSTIDTEKLTKVKLQPGNLTDVKTKTALESIKEDWDPLLKEKVQKAIIGSLSHVLFADTEIP